MITWLIGKSENIDLIYSAYPYRSITQPEIAINTYLFEENNFKYIFTKKDIELFKKDHDIFQNNIVIKGLPTINKEIIDESKDMILNIDTMSKIDVFNLYISINKINFETEELQYIQKLNSLSNLSTIITLKKLKININLWNNFIKDNRDFWFKKAKENQLIQEQIIKNDEILPMINYLIVSNHKKKEILIFIKATIKSGEQLWILYKFWESLIQI